FLFAFRRKCMVSIVTTMPNQTSHNHPECPSSSHSPNLIPTLYFLMFPIALLLNSVAAWVSVHLKATSTFVVYLKNLVAADLIMTLTLPIEAANELAGKSTTLYALTCRYFSVIFYSTLSTCIAFLGFIGLDRFFKIMLPRSRLFGQNLIFSKVTSALIWIMMFGCTGLPNVIFTNQPVTNLTAITSCMHLKGPVGLLFHEKTVLFANVFFWVVSVVIVVCYICIANKVIQSFRNSGSINNQGNQKVKLRVFMVIIVFFVSYGPYHIVRIPYTFIQLSDSSDDCSFEAHKFAKELSLWLATTNICMDPLLYVFLCREFKEKLMLMTEKSHITQVDSNTAVVII
uniref:Purinergic receptor P2Y13 n=1 Tax=Salarias fasciatus TaxID=181472 RepID=A0A672FX53_SALFA